MILFVNTSYAADSLFKKSGMNSMLLNVSVIGGKVFDVFGPKMKFVKRFYKRKITHSHQKLFLLSEEEYPSNLIIKCLVSLKYSIY